jgi:hypothetical protein
MELTLRWLENQNACEDAIIEFKNQNESDVFKILKYLRDHNFEWHNWLFAKKLNKNNKKKFAIYCAEKVLYLYEEKYPNDSMPRDAIKAAKKNLKNKNTTAYAIYAVNAADAAAAAGAVYTIYAADAAGAAAAAGAVYTIYAADAAGAAAAVYANTAGIKLKIYNYGIKLLKKQINEEI